jgi:L-ascorbate metabolism protein UlaG (beta-lactamase superfamily)
MQGQHLDPTEALQAFGDLGAKVLLPIHWGCFRLSEEPLGEPPAWLEALAKEKGLEEQVHLWPIGGGYPLKASARVVKGHTL